MAKKPATTKDETQNLYASHLLARYLKVAMLLDGDVIEIVPGRGHRISFVHQVVR